MTDKPVDLDEHRGMVAQKKTEIRRRLHEVQADQAALGARQEELERFMLATEATSWPEAAAKARYLIQLYAATPDGQTHDGRSSSRAPSRSSTGCVTNDDRRY